MSSREIAELIEKRHDNIVRDIRLLLDALRDSSDLRNVREDKDARGYTACFHLPKDLTITLVAGYSAPLRYRIVQRWEELENTQAHPQAVALTPLDMLAQMAQHMADQARQQNRQAVDIWQGRLDRKMGLQSPGDLRSPPRHQRPHLPSPPPPTR